LFNAFDCVKTFPQVTSSGNDGKYNKEVILVITDTLLSDVVEPASGPSVIYAGDYLNKLTGERIEYECRRRLEAGHSEIIVDFSHTELVNSIGISILLGLIDIVAAHGGSVAFSKMNDNTIELFDMLGLTKHVNVV
jgi:anti-anti-sigma regulatory factor